MSRSLPQSKPYYLSDFTIESAEGTKHNENVQFSESDYPESSHKKNHPPYSCYEGGNYPWRPKLVLVPGCKH